MKRPLIALTAGMNQEETSLILGRSNLNAIYEAGGMPIMLPMLTGKEELEEIAEQFDGFLLTGGGDIDGYYFGEETMPESGAISPERDAMEIQLANILAGMGKPTLGICRGAQVMNVACGGDIWQDIFSQKPGCLAHRQKQRLVHLSHQIQVTEGTKLAEMLGETLLRVNSCHHQAVRNPGEGVVFTAYASDGIVEALELQQHPFYVGVQWHPEKTFEYDEPSARLFKAFVDACRK